MLSWYPPLHQQSLIKSAKEKAQMNKGEADGEERQWWAAKATFAQRSRSHDGLQQGWPQVIGAGYKYISYF